MAHWSLVAVLSLVMGCGSTAGVPQVGPERALVLLQKAEVVLLDVRTEGEYRERHIPDTDALIPLQELLSRLKELDFAKKRPILVYCRSGNRSLQAAELLKKNGFQDVTDLEGGILAWTARGNPTAEGAFVPPPR